MDIISLLPTNDDAVLLVLEKLPSELNGSRSVGLIGSFENGEVVEQIISEGDLRRIATLTPGETITLLNQNMLRVERSTRDSTLGDDVLHFYFDPVDNVDLINVCFTHLVKAYNDM